jgi:hypothetical protein
MKKQITRNPVVSVQRTVDGKRYEQFLRAEADGATDDDVRAALDRLLADPAEHVLVTAASGWKRSAASRKRVAEERVAATHTG